MHNKLRAQLTYWAAASLYLDRASKSDASLETDPSGLGSCPQLHSCASWNIAMLRSERTINLFERCSTS